MREFASSPFRVAIVGGGYAGFAAAVELASRGINVRLFEAGPVLGGRARRITYRDRDLDNGAHILRGAYRVQGAVGVPASGLLRLPLQWVIKDRLKVHTAGLPAPFPGKGGRLPDPKRRAGACISATTTWQETSRPHWREPCAAA